jgi:hypothetical protein
MRVRTDRQANLPNHVRRQRKRADRWGLARFMCSPIVTSCLLVTRPTALDFRALRFPVRPPPTRNIRRQSQNFMRWSNS